MSGAPLTLAPTIKEFVEHYTPGELFVDWIVGPMGSGKTTGLFAKLMHMTALQEPSPHDLVRRARAVWVGGEASLGGRTELELHMQHQAKSSMFVQPSGFSPDAENTENLPGGRSIYERIAVASGWDAAWVEKYIGGGREHAL